MTITQQGLDLTEVTTTYQYDAFGRRINKQTETKDKTRRVNRQSAKIFQFPVQQLKTQHSQVNYLWDGNRQLQEQTDTHVFTTFYEQDSFEPVARLVWLQYGIEIAANEPVYHDNPHTKPDTNKLPKIQVYHCHNDHLGTPNELTNQDGEVVWLADYEAYGNTAKVVWREEKLGQIKVSSEELQPIRFQGQSFDVETGLHYNRFRYFDPDLGMFTTRDPIGLMGGLNVFQYAPNPIGWVDPFGLSACDEAKPNHGGWNNAPNWDRWRERGGTVTPNKDGSVTYTRSDGVAVNYNKDGYPDFSPFAVYNVPVQGLKGNHTTDFKLANEAAGIGTTQATPSPYTDTHTWHHHENGVDMLLVPKDIHNVRNGGFSHAGGVSNSKNLSQR